MQKFMCGFEPDAERGNPGKTKETIPIDNTNRKTEKLYLRKILKNKPRECVMKKIDDIYNGGRFKIERVEVDLPGGVTLERVVVKPGGAVAMLPIEGDSCYLIKQYRYPIDEYIYEAPAGTMNEGETPDETAYRELIEETGYRSDRLVPIGFIYTTPGYTNERIWLYEAHSLTPSNEFHKDEDELIEVVKVKKEEVFEMIRDGRIVDAKTICLVLKSLLSDEAVKAYVNSPGNE